MTFTGSIFRIVNRHDIIKQIARHDSLLIEARGDTGLTSSDASALPVIMKGAIAQPLTQQKSPGGVSINDTLLASSHGAVRRRLAS